MSIAYNTSVVRSGLVLQLDAANVKSYPGTGTTWTDISGNSNTGALVNGPTFNNGNKGSIAFDGIDDYASNVYQIPNNFDFSVNFWMYFTDVTNADRGIITTWDTSWKGFGICTYTLSPGYLRSWTNDGAGGGMNWVLLSTLVNQWTHVALTYTFSTKTQRGYINSDLKNSESLGSAITHSALQIARGGQNGSQQLSLYPPAKMNMSTIFIYNRVLTAAEIAQNFNATRGRYGI